MRRPSPAASPELEFVAGIVPPALSIHSFWPVSSFSAKTLPPDDPMITTWFTTIGDVSRLPSPVKLQRTVLLLLVNAFSVPLCRKYPAVASNAGSPMAMYVPTTVPLDASTTAPCALEFPSGE